MGGERMVCPNHYHGWRPDVDRKHADMKKQFVYDPLISKRQQYLLATQVRSVIF